jgi:hypothetical protein
MELNNNKPKSIYIKNTRYIKDQRIHLPVLKNKDLGENNLSEKNDISLIKGNNSKNKKTIKEEPKNGSLKKNDAYYNENKKNKMVNENVKLFIDNITNNEANSVNIHNINLINSMNNITFFDSYHENKISNQKNDLIQKPINKFKSHQFYKMDNSKNSSSIDFNNNQRNNIIVNKKRIYLNKRKNKNISKSITIVHNVVDMKKSKNGPEKQRKNKYCNNIYHKNMNTAINKLKSVSKYNKGNHSLNSNKKEYKIQKSKLGNLNAGGQNNATKRKKSINSNNNNSLNKTNNKENLNSKSEYFIFNTCSNYSNSVIDEESYRFNKKMILDRMNSKKNIINVNKLEIFKNKNNFKNSNDNSMDNTLYLSNFKKKNNSNIKISSSFASNILSLISNNKNNNSKIDIENLNKIRKNIIHDKLYRARSKDYFNYSKLAKKKSNKNNNNSKSNKSNKNSKSKSKKYKNEKPK